MVAERMRSEDTGKTSKELCGAQHVELSRAMCGHISDARCAPAWFPQFLRAAEFPAGLRLTCLCCHPRSRFIVLVNDSGKRRLDSSEKFAPQRVLGSRSNRALTKVSVKNPSVDGR